MRVAHFVWPGMWGRRGSRWGGVEVRALCDGRLRECSPSLDAECSRFVIGAGAVGIIAHTNGGA